MFNEFNVQYSMRQSSKPSRNDNVLIFTDINPNLLFNFLQRIGNLRENKQSPPGLDERPSPFSSANGVGGPLKAKTVFSGQSFPDSLAWTFLPGQPFLS